MAKFLAVALEGDFCDRLGDIARICGRVPIGEPQFFADWGSVAPLVSEKGYLAAARSGDWTVLVDDGSVTGEIFEDLDFVAAALAEELSTRVVSAYGNSVSGMCGFRVHSPGATRAVLVADGGVVEDEGEPIPGEVPVVFDEYNEYSVLQALKLLGIDIAEGVERCSRSALIQFADEAEDSTAEPEVAPDCGGIT